MDSAALRVAYGDSAPRLTDLALLLCEGALRRLRPQLAAHPDWADILYGWYMHKIAFLSAAPEDPPPPWASECGAAEVVGDATSGSEAACGGVLLNTSGGDGVGVASPFGSPCRTNAGVTSHRGPHGNAGDVDFSLAFEQTCGTAMSVSFQGQHSTITESTREPSTEIANSSESRALLEKDPGFQLLREVLALCFHLGGVSLSASAAIVFRELLEGTATERCSAMKGAINNSSSSEVELLALARLFDWTLSEEESLSALGSATRSFHVWVNVAWRCASFTRQSRHASLARVWARELMQDVKCDPLDASHLYREGRFAAVMEEAGQGINIEAMYLFIREVFEGHARSEKALMELLFSQTRPSQLPDTYTARLLLLQGPATASAVSRQDLINRGSQPILHNVTCGMLLYSRYYLAAHSLTLACQCAQTAVLVGHQLHSSSTLALAHYSCFLAYIASCRTTEAADNISIALQLSVSQGGDAAAADHATTVSGDLTVGALSFIGVAHLLLLFPATVGSTLRSMLTMGLDLWVSSSPSSLAENAGAGMPVVDPSSSSPPLAGASGGGTASTGNGSGTGGGHAVVEQTIAQTLRHALLLSEIEAFHHPVPCFAWVEMTSALSRDCLLLTGTMYGVTVSPMHIDTPILGGLLAQLKDELLVSSPAHQVRPSAALLAEVIRHTAHHSLALQEGLTEPSPESEKSGPVEVLCDALSAIQTHYGEGGVRAAEQDAFFSGTARYLVACWLARNGFIAAAFEGFSDVIDGLHHTAGLFTSSDSTIEKSGEDLYLPPDHLLLLAYSQLRRAEVALYLGYYQSLEHSAATLLAVSVRANFTFGVLVSQFIELFSLQHKNSCSEQLAASAALLHSANAMGLYSILLRVRLRRVSALSSGGRWQEALEELDRITEPVPRAYSAAHALAKFNVGSEVLLGVVQQSERRKRSQRRQCAAALSNFISEGISVLSGIAGIGPETDAGTVLRGIATETLNFCVSLQEALCIHTSVLRASDLCADAHLTCASDCKALHNGIHKNSVGHSLRVIESLAQSLSARHLLHGVWAKMLKSTMTAACREIMNGTLIRMLDPSLS